MKCKTCKKSLWKYNQTGYCVDCLPREGKHNPFYGKHHTNKTKKMIVVGAKKRMGKNNGMFGRGHTDESKKLQSELAKKRIADNPKLLEGLRKNGVKSSLTSFRITKPQRAVQEWLNEENIPYTINGLIDRYSYDFILREYNIIIEVQGTYWHSDPRVYGEGKYPLTERQVYKVQQDKIKKELAETHGYKVYYIWEIDIKNHLIEKILHDVKLYHLRNARRKNSSTNGGVM